MKDSTVKAYARAFCVLRRAILRKDDTGRADGSVITPHMLEECMSRPADGMTPLFLRATKMKALTEADNDLIGAFLEGVDVEDIHTPRPIPQEQQGIWLLEYYHWRDYYTVSEAADELGVSKQRISKLIKDGRLDYVKVRNRYYISNQSVELRKDEEDD